MGLFSQQSIARPTTMVGMRSLALALGIVIAISPLAVASTPPSVGSYPTGSHPSLHALTRTVRSAPLPSISSDAGPIALSSDVTLPRAAKWLSRVIGLRQSELFAVGNSLAASRGILPSDRSELQPLIDGATSKLNVIAIRSSSDATVSAVVRQANLVLSLQILTVLVPEIRQLVRVDWLLGAAAQLSLKENSAAAAIALSRVAPKALQSEQALDMTLRSLVQSISTALLGAQRELLALPTKGGAIPASVFSDVNATIAAQSVQFRLANSDLRLLVAQLVSR